MTHDFIHWLTIGNKKKKHPKMLQRISSTMTTMILVTHPVIIDTMVATTLTDKTSIVTIMKPTLYMLDLLKRKVQDLHQDCMHKPATKMQLLCQHLKDLTKI